MIVCMCVACISYLDDGSPTLNFKQDIIVQNSIFRLPIAEQNRLVVCYGNDNLKPYHHV